MTSRCCGLPYECEQTAAKVARRPLAFAAIIQSCLDDRIAAWAPERKLPKAALVHLRPNAADFRDWSANAQPGEAASPFRSPSPRRGVRFETGCPAPGSLFSYFAGARQKRTG